MRSIVCGLDYPPRPHMTSWFARAFRRLGCDVIRVAPGHTPCGDDKFVDPCYEPPDVIVGQGQKFVSLGQVLAATGPADLCVMVDQGDDWAVVDDGSCPFAYVWREGNPGEEFRVHTATASGCPVFCCMTGKGTRTPANTTLMPFATDRMFVTDGWPWESRKYDLVYTGRERGAGTSGRFEQEIGSRSTFPGYVKGYDQYFLTLVHGRTSYVVDSGRYVGSRGIEGAACAQVVFWDGGPMFDLMQMEFDRDCLKLDRVIDPVTKEYIPTPDFSEKVKSICSDRHRWTKISRNAVRTIRRLHTYERRAETIATAVGVKLPITADELDALA